MLCHTNYSIGPKLAAFFPSVLFLITMAAFTPQSARAASAISPKLENIQDFSPESEELYVQKVRQWLDALPRAKQDGARAILRAARPELHALREQICAKTTQLASLSYDKNTPPQALARLGQKLQKLKVQLREKLLRLEDRLRQELGLSLGPLASEGLWLNTEPNGTGAPSPNSPESH